MEDQGLPALRVLRVTRVIQVQTALLDLQEMMANMVNEALPDQKERRVNLETKVDLVQEVHQE